MKPMVFIIFFGTCFVLIIVAIVAIIEIVGNYIYKLFKWLPNLNTTSFRRTDNHIKIDYKICINIKDLYTLEDVNSETVSVPMN